MSTLKYNKYKVGQILASVSEDSLLLLANELVRLKDEQGVNLFWDDNEEKQMRACVENTINFCNN
ncbi:MAG: hypothetical protein JSV11_00090 [Nitrospiraceae bacterium]|nr:MAG: hypothetical protein JSU99_07655 [Nitrospiraceae bacterium]UCH45143.1 MAG: hypothetical protein JSV11_00090 [Nitrospiraceae bacterium]